MKFKKITETKYIGTDGYSLIQCKSGLFSICKGGQVTKWGTGFQTVRSAEIFLESRDYVRASTYKLPIEKQDLNFIQLVYGASLFKKKDRSYQIKSDPFVITVPEDFKDSHQVILQTQSKEDISEVIDDVESLLLKLDDLSQDIAASSVIYRGPEIRQIIAKSQRRPVREIVKDLIRVKSSNVWAYGVEIKENNANVGDVYVQFKGRNGGPEDIYRYYDVPVTLWRKFVGSPSKGHFLWKYLRNNFLYSKLTGDKKGKLKNAVN